MLADIYDLLLVRAGYAVTRGRWRLVGTVMATPFGPVYRPVWFNQFGRPADPPGWLAWWRGASERVDAELTWFQFRAHVEGPLQEPSRADFGPVEELVGDEYVCPHCGELVLIPTDDDDD